MNNIRVHSICNFQKSLLIKLFSKFKDFYLKLFLNTAVYLFDNREMCGSSDRFQVSFTSSILQLHYLIIARLFK